MHCLRRIVVSAFRRGGGRLDGVAREQGEALVARARSVCLHFTNTIKNILRPSANYKALLVRQRVDHEGLKLMSLLWDELSSDEVSDRDPQAA